MSTRRRRRGQGRDRRDPRRPRLLDEIVIHVAPILLGDGVRLYGAPGSQPVDLELVSGSEAGQVVDLAYRVVK